MSFQNAIAVFPRRRVVRRGYGLRGLGDDWTAGVGASGVADPATVQAALNAAYSPSGTHLVVDGIWGAKSIARMREFQKQIGLSPNGSVNDYPALVALGVFAGNGQSGPTILDAAQRVLIGGPSAGLPISRGGDVTLVQQQAVADLNYAVAQTAGTQAKAGSNSDGSYSLTDWLTLKPITDAFSSSAKTTVQDIAVAGNWTAETAKEAVKGGGAAAQDALKWLGANGDLFAKIALGLGVSYVVATAIVIGGGAAVAIVILKKMK